MGNSDISSLATVTKDNHCTDIFSYVTGLRITLISLFHAHYRL